MFDFKKVLALSATALLFYGGANFIVKNDRAEAVTWRPAIQPIMSRPYPIYFGNQFNSKNLVSNYTRVPKIMDVITINKSDDLFVDYGASIDLADKLRSLIPGVKVLQYLNLVDVWDYSNTYKWMASNGVFLYDDAGKIIHPYNTSQRYAGDPIKYKWQDYYANRAGSITSQGMDGIFSDNWWRSNFQNWNVSPTRFTQLQNGWNTIGQKAKSKMGTYKILLGNGPAFGIYQSRDMSMLEMRNKPNYTDFNNYLKMSDESVSYGQGNLDSIQAQFNGSDFMHSYSSILSFSLPACLLTDNMFGIPNDSNVFNIINQVGKIGTPKAPRYRWNNIWRRDFSGGTVLFNDTSSSKTLTVGPGFKNLSGNSVSSVSISSYRGIILKADLTIPAAPGNLTVDAVRKTDTGSYFVDLSWKDNSTNESGFEIYQAINSTNSADFKLIKTPLPNVQRYGINIGTNPIKGTYYYKIFAVNNAGKSAASNTASGIVN